MQGVSIAVRSIAAHPVARSILGKVAISAVSEIAGSMIGAYIGGPMIGIFCKRLGAVAPIAAAGAALWSLRSRVFLAAIAVLGVPNPIDSIPRIWEHLTGACSEIGYRGGFWLGQSAGVILGGYAGLRASGSDVPFWQSTVSCDSYSVGMVKFLLAGEILERTISTCAIPFISFPVNVGRTLIFSCIKTMAYNSNSVLSAFKSLIRRKGLGQDVLAPLFFKVFLSRYCQHNAAHVANKLIYAISQPFNCIPLFSRQIRGFLGLFSGYFQEGLKIIGDQGDKLTTLIMRRFVQYADFIANLGEVEDLEETLKQQLKVSQIVLVFMNQIEIQSKIEEAVSKALASIQELEQDLIGIPQLLPSEEMRKKVCLHIKYFLLFLLQDLDISLLSPEEEKRFFQYLANKIIFLYSEKSSHHRMVSVVEKVILGSISAFFFLKWSFSKFIMQRDEDAVLMVPLEMQDKFLPPPMEEEKEFEFIN